MRTVQLYTGTKSPRLIYSFDLVFKNILGLDYYITDKPDDKTPLVNYSNDRSVGGLFIQPEKILFQTGIEKQDIWVAHLDGVPLFFQQPPEAGFVIDVFAFAFYLCSRYEEYLPFTRDEHGRFAAESSLAYKHNFLRRPVVDIWVLRFAKTLNFMYPGLEIPVNGYSSLLTVDIDMPFEYRSNSISGHIRGILKDMFAGKDVMKRIRCISGRGKDPFDTYDFIEDVAKESGLKLKYFITTGNRGRFDRNPLPYRPCYKKLIRKLSSRHEVGLHPSYRSNSDEKMLAKEISRLEKITGKKVDSLRKHYLLLNFPVTYQQLEKMNISRDYTLGYAREPGYRGSIARPYLFYDLENERTTELLLVPFQFMDISLQKYKRYTPEEAYQNILEMINETRNVGGMFVSLWHNTSLSGEDGWSGWKEVFSRTVKEQALQTMK